MRRASLCSLLGLSLAVLGCGQGSQDDGKITIAVVTNNPADFWTICEAGAKKAATDLDVHVDFRKPEKGEVAVQMQIVNDLLKRDVAGLAVSVIDPENQTPDLHRIAKETYLIAMDNDARETNRLCYVGTNNYEAGRAVGRLVKEAMPEGGMIVVFVGQLTSFNARERVRGVREELGIPGSDKYTMYQDEAITDDADETKAQNNARDIVGKLGDRPNLCMVGLWAYNPPAILEAVRSKGLVGKIKIVGFDEDPRTLDGIAKGEIAGTVVQDPFNFGYRSVEILAAVAQGKTNRAEIEDEYIPYRIITKDGREVRGERSIEVSEFAEDLQAKLDSVK